MTRPPFDIEYRDADLRPILTVQCSAVPSVGDEVWLDDRTVVVTKRSWAHVHPESLAWRDGKQAMCYLQIEALRGR